MQGDYAPTLVGRVEVPNDRVREARELAERSEDALSEQVRGRFIEAYISGEFKVGLRCTLGQAANYGFTLSAFRRTGGSFETRPLGVADPQGNGNDDNGEQPLVLADNVEQMEGVQKPIPSLVRSERFYDLSYIGGEGLYEFVPLVIAPFKVIETGRHRKVSIVKKRWAVAHGQGGGKNIEAAPNSIDVRPGFDVEAEGKRLFFERYHLVVRNVRWKIFNTHIDVSVEPTIQSLTEGWEMGYGPVDRRLRV